MTERVAKLLRVKRSARGMFKFIFEILTDPLGLPIEWYWEYLILAVIGAVHMLLLTAV